MKWTKESSDRAAPASATLPTSRAPPSPHTHQEVPQTYHASLKKIPPCSVHSRCSVTVTHSDFQLIFPFKSHHLSDLQYGVSPAVRAMSPADLLVIWITDALSSNSESGVEVCELPFTAERAAEPSRHSLRFAANPAKNTRQKAYFIETIGESASGQRILTYGEEGGAGLVEELRELHGDGKKLRVTLRHSAEKKGHVPGKEMLHVSPTLLGTNQLAQTHRKIQEHGCCLRGSRNVADRYKTVALYLLFCLKCRSLWDPVYYYYQWLLW
eukprot:238375-Rhodomonas_salina.1